MLDVLKTPYHDWLVELRRFFHQIPELAYKEEKTAAKIMEVLEDLGVPFQSGIAGTGIVACLSASRSGPTVAMRADMDALPLEEQTDVPFRSRNRGVMHACGHDAHVTIMLGVARSMVETGWVGRGVGKVLFVFQPAEEGGAGAQTMIQGGIFARDRPEAIFAGHVDPELPVGHIALAEDVSNAASNNIDIRLKGRGGHGAQPHLCIDPIVAGADLVLQLQTLISRSVPPIESAVLTIGRFHAGTARNIIPQEAVLNGTLRTLSEEVRRRLIERIHQVVKGVELSQGVKAEISVREGYPLLVNDRSLVNLVKNEGAALLGEGAVHRGSPRMGSEDFAFFLQECPGVIVRLGCHDPAEGFTHGLHSPFFRLDERVLDVGVRLFGRLLESAGKPR